MAEAGTSKLGGPRVAQ